MISEIVLALGLVVVIEGLALALAPKRWEDMIRIIAAMSYDKRRFIGLILISVGIVVIWIARRY